LLATPRCTTSIDLPKEAAYWIPPKPVVDGEPAYEDIPVRFWEFMDFDRPGRERVPEGVLSPEGKVVRREHFAEGLFSSPPGQPLK